MNMLFGLDYEHFCITYMDDLLIFSGNSDEHKYHMRQVFTHLCKGGWHVKRSKCEVFLQEAEFLGHRITADGILMVPGKVEVVAIWSIPTCLREL